MDFALGTDSTFNGHTSPYSSQLTISYSNEKYSCTSGFQWCLGVEADMGFAFYGRDCSQRRVRNKSTAGSRELRYVHRDCDTVGLMTRDVESLHHLYKVTVPEMPLKEVRLCAIFLNTTRDIGMMLNWRHSEPYE